MSHFGRPLGSHWATLGIFLPFVWAPPKPALKSVEIQKENGQGKKETGQGTKKKENGHQNHQNLSKKLCVLVLVMEQMRIKLQKSN